jgi:hypothetical protein
MNGKWVIDDVDLYADLGVLLLKGSYGDIMSPPVPKKRLEYDYADKNGVDVDTTTAVVYEPKRFKLSVAITASTSAEFWSRYNALLGLIDKAGSFSLYISDLGLRVNLIYEGAKCISKSKSLKSGSVVVAYELSVLEPDPTNRQYD